MKKGIIGGIMGVLLTIVVLGIINYFTCFAYYLPHEPTIIEVSPRDTLLTVHPQFILINSELDEKKVFINPNVNNETKLYTSGNISIFNKYKRIGDTWTWISCK